MDATQDLRDFSRFVADRVAAGEPALPEECLTLWRAEHPLPPELSASVADLRASLADLDADRTRDFDSVNNEIRERQGWGRA